jgi:DNA-binding winged helix-turn-helix (wHTH) protein
VRVAQRMHVEKQNQGRLVIRMFGSLAIEDGARTLGPGDLGGARPKQVLEILLAARGHRVATDRLADLLWPVQRPQNTAGSLQTFVSTLRHHLSRDRARSRELIVTEAEAYRFATDSVDFDLDRFDGLVERSAGEPTSVARRTLEHALALVRGDLLEDEPYVSWAQDLRSTYQGRVLAIAGNPATTQSVSVASAPGSGLLMTWLAVDGTNMYSAWLPEGSDTFDATRIITNSNSDSAPVVTFNPHTNTFELVFRGLLVTNGWSEESAHEQTGVPVWPSVLALNFVAVVTTTAGIVQWKGAWDSNKGI